PEVVHASDDSVNTRGMRKASVRSRLSDPTHWIASPFCAAVTFARFTEFFLWPAMAARQPDSALVAPATSNSWRTVAITCCGVQSWRLGAQGYDVGDVVSSGDEVLADAGPVDDPPPHPTHAHASATTTT